MKQYFWYLWVDANEFFNNISCFVMAQGLQMVLSWIMAAKALNTVFEVAHTYASVFHQALLLFHMRSPGKCSI